MKKFAKRTLALLLVVCMLLGTMAMSAFAAGATAESDGSFYYDFTIPGDPTNNMNWQLDQKNGDDHTYTASAGFGGKDGMRIIAEGPEAQDGAWKNYYENGSHSFYVTAEDKIVTYECDINWKVLDVKGNVALDAASSNSGTDAQPIDYARFGGTVYNKPILAEGSNSFKYAYNGLHYFYGGNSTNEMPGGWVAVKIKAPDVGRYDVSLDYSKANNGAKQGSVYILPGVADRDAIEAAISSGEGKLDTTVDYFIARSNTNYNSWQVEADGTTSTTTGCRTGETISLGAIDCNVVAAEYTVIFTTDKDYQGNTGVANKSARLYVDGLRLTPAEQQAEVKLYDFQVRTTVDSALNNFTEDDELLTSYYNNGTIDWDYIGCSESQAAQDRTLNDTYAYIKGSGKSGWWAFKLRAPGSGVFNLEMTTYTPAANKTQVWTDAYIVEHSEGMDYSTVIADSNFVGSIRPERSDAGAAGNFVTDAFGSKEFVAGKDYVLVLNINPDIYTINKDHSTVTPIGDAFMTNHLYIQSITATAVPQTVATVGEDFTPPADVLYNFDLYGQNPTDYPKFDSKNAVITDLNDANVQQKLDTWYNASENALNWDYLGTTFTGSGNYAPRVDGNYLLFSTGGSTTAKEENGQNKDNRYVAFKLKSPGAGEFALEMTVHNMGASGYDAGHLWLNAYLVKINGTTVTEANYEDALATATVTGEFKPLHSAMEDGKLGTAPLLTADFDAGAEYILFLERHPDADLAKDDGNTTYSPNNIYLNSIIAKSTQVASSKTPYTSLSEALEAAAETGETVELVGPALETSVVVPDGVTLDLNGHKLTTSNFATGTTETSTGKIIDSTAGGGLLNVLADNATFLGTAPLAQSTMPVYDDANTGYRFYAYTYSNQQVHPDPDVEGAQRFWFQFQFTNPNAYALMNAGNSGIKLGVKVAWPEGSEDYIFKADDSADAFTQGYANMAININEGKTPWLWVRVQGADDVESLTITPVITAGGVDFVCTAITYPTN